MVNALNDQAWHRMRQTVCWDHWVRWFEFVNERKRNVARRVVWRMLLNGKLVARACEELELNDES